MNKLLEQLEEAKRLKDEGMVRMIIDQILYLLDQGMSAEEREHREIEAKFAEIEKRKKKEGKVLEQFRGKEWKFKKEVKFRYQPVVEPTTVNHFEVVKNGKRRKLMLEFKELLDKKNYL